MDSYLSFHTTRLTIKPTDISDAEFILELFNSPKWLEFIGDRRIYSVEDAKNYIKTKIRPQLERLGFSNYTIMLKNTQTKIGICGIYDREGLNAYDIGFALLANYEGNGYAFEATNKLMESASSIFNITEICSITTKNNFSSQKLLQKLGMKEQGLIILPDDNEELIYFKKTLKNNI